MRNLVTRFAKDESGAAMVEYGLLVALIAVIAIPNLTTLGAAVNTLFGNVAGNL
jgi:pilus assembly protein Flp/PilA